MDNTSKEMHIAVVGCTHGALDTIYDKISQIELQRKIQIDLVLCCGDFEAVRNQTDLDCLAGPSKYHYFKDFYQYYNGEKVAAKTTIFVGGNHEAANHLRELYYGGWAAPNIYFLGYSGVVNFGGVRIAGFSGIYKRYNFLQGHFEVPPYNENEKRSAFHVRKYELWKLEQIKEPIDIIMSHDWPDQVLDYGDSEKLFQEKPYFKDEINDGGSLGCREYTQLLLLQKPKFWLSGHMHVKFEAKFIHNNKNNNNNNSNNKNNNNNKQTLTTTTTTAATTTTTTTSVSTITAEKTAETPPMEFSSVATETKFLALDKPVPGREFLDVISIIPSKQQPKKLFYDAEWLSLLKTLQPTIPTTNLSGFKPPKIVRKLLEENREWISEHIQNLEIPENFAITVLPHYSLPEYAVDTTKDLPMFNTDNIQTKLLTEKLGIPLPGLLLLPKKPIQEKRSHIENRRERVIPETIGRGSGNYERDVYQPNRGRNRGHGGRGRGGNSQSDRN